MFQLKLDFAKSVYQPGNIINVNDGGYVACGTLRDNSIKFPYLLKITASGQEKWRSVFETGNLSSTCHFVLQTTDGGYLMVGEIYLTAQNSDIYIIRTDSSGNQLWNRSYGGILADFGNNVVQLSSGNYLIFGESHLPQKAGLAIRIDDNGTVLEENHFSLRFANSTVRGERIDLNQIIVTGAGVNEIYTDTSGVYQAESSISLPDSGITEDVIVTPSGKHISIANMYIVSSTGHQLYIVCTDSTGAQSPSWVKLYGLTSIPVGVPAATILPSANGGFVIAGSLYQSFGFPGWLYLSALDSTGNLLWEKGYSPNSFGFGRGGAAPTTDGGYILTGSGYDGVNKNDLYIIKTDSAGNSACFSNPASNPITTGNFSTVLPQAFVTASLVNTGTTHPLTNSGGGVASVLCYTSVPETLSKSPYSLFPNPFYDNLAINLDSIDSEHQALRFFNMLGELLLTVDSDNQSWSDPKIKTLPAGLLIIELLSNSKVLGRYKMLHSVDSLD